MTAPETAVLVELAVKAHQAAQIASQYRATALAERKQAIKELAASGMTMTDISALLGISRSRVGLIMNDNKILNPGVRKKKRRPRAARPLHTPGTPLPEWDGIL